MNFFLLRPLRPKYEFIAYKLVKSTCGRSLTLEISVKIKKQIQFRVKSAAELLLFPTWFVYKFLITFYDLLRRDTS